MKNKRILIADDDEKVRNLLDTILRGEGYEVMQASDGGEAVKLAKESPIDLALLDIRMPVLSGIDAMKAVKEINGKTEILIITGYADLDDFKQVLTENGASDYLVKPFDNEELLGTVRGALLKRECSVLDDYVDTVSRDRIIQLEKEFERRTRQLRESQIKYKEIVENSNDIITVIQEGKLKFVNTKAFELTGYKEEEVLDTPFLNFIFPKDLAEIEQRYRDRLEGNGQDGIYPFRLLRKSGEAFWVEENSKQTLWQGKPAVLAFVRDISERKKTEDALIESERKYRHLVQSANSIIVYFDPQGRITFLNKFGQDFFGYAEEEIIGKNIIGTIVPGKDTHGRDLHKLVGDIIKHPERHAYNESENIRKNGERVWIAWTNRNVVDLDESPLGVLSIGMDITDRRHAEEALRESEEKFKQFANSLPQIVFETNEKGDFTFVNHNAFDVFGYTQDDFDKGLNALQMVIPEEREFARMNIERKLRGETIGGLEYTAQRKDGSPFPVVIHSNRVIRDGKPVGLRGIIVDVTDHKRAEEELKKAHSEMDNLISSLSSAFIGLSHDSKIVKWNPAAEKMFNIVSSAASGKTFEECGIDWDWGRVNAGICECQDTIAPTVRDKVRYKRADGKDGFLNLRISPVYGNDNEFAGSSIIAMDVTEQRILENQLMQAQKLESIGQLAAGIAHEINTPTQYVGDNTRFLQDAFGDFIQVLEKYAELFKMVESGNVEKDFLLELGQQLEDADVDYLLEEIPTAIKQSLEGTDRIAKIVLAMKEFSHPGTAEKTEIDINKAIESTATVARNEWKYTAELVTDFDSSLPPVPCHVGEFNQVILNMIINAVHAINDVVGDGSASKGTITVSTRNKGQWAEIRIRDTGSGIPEEIQSRIFDPFFTTKEVGKGTGQGLAICHSVIVEKHQGTLTFDTETGKGTTFVIRLPIRRKGQQKGSGDEIKDSFR